MAGDITGAAWRAEYDGRGAWIVPDNGGGSVFLSLDDIERLRQAVRLERTAAYDDARPTTPVDRLVPDACGRPLVLTSTDEQEGD